jgi:hypothetical protein
VPYRGIDAALLDHQVCATPDAEIGDCPQFVIDAGYEGETEDTVSARAWSPSICLSHRKCFRSCVVSQSPPLPSFSFQIAQRPTLVLHRDRAGHHTSFDIC